MSSGFLQPKVSWDTAGNRTSRESRLSETPTVWRNTSVTLSETPTVWRNTSVTLARDIRILVRGIKWFLIQCLRDVRPCYRLRRQPACILPCLYLVLTMLLSRYSKMFVLVGNKCDVHPLRCLVINVNLCIGRTMSEAWQPKRLPVPAPNFSALQLANINHRLLQRLNVKYMPQNCSAHQCEYPLPSQRPPCHMWRLRESLTEIIAWSSLEPQARDWNSVSRIGSSLAETETWKSLHLWSGVLLLTCWFKRLQKCVDYLFQSYADRLRSNRVRSEEKNYNSDDFKSMKPTNNWHDDQVQFI